MALKDLLAVQEVVTGAERIVYRMVPSYPLAWVIGADKAPSKVQGQTEVEVPSHVWGDAKERDAAIIRVMARMAEGYLVQARDPSAVTRALWTKLRFNHELVILNPLLRGKLFIPERSEILFTDTVPADRVLCLARHGLVGTLMVQGERSGYILPIQKGVMGIRLHNVS